MDAPPDPLSAAQDECRQLGFQDTPEGALVHRQFSIGTASLELRIEFPAEFPSALPHLFVNRDQLPRRLPHIDEAGKICLAPETGVLLDIDRPRQLVRDAIERARSILAVTDEAAMRLEFLREFAAYWEHNAGFTALIDIDPNGVSRAVPARKTPGEFYVVADTEQRRDQWRPILRQGENVLANAFFLRLHTPFLPPDYQDSWSAEHILAYMEGGAAEVDFSRLFKWLESHRLPLLIVFSFPHNDESIVGCFQIPASPRLNTPGFRSGKAPKEMALKVAASRRVVTGRTLRADPTFLLDRTGGDTSLVGKSATVVGVGSVGSYVAETIATAGVGTLRLIDPDHLVPHNVRRHALGADAIGENKAKAMAARLRLRFPGLVTEALTERVEVAIQTRPNFFASDIVVLATGEENVGLSVEPHLLGQRRLHVWVEAYGLGGHVLAIPQGRRPGCFRCLFGDNGSGAFVNRASLAEPGQDFQRIVGGCQGVFTPFGDTDARAAGVAAARFCIRVLSGDLTAPTLHSWKNSDSAFDKRGFHQSARGRRVIDSVTRSDIAEDSCPVCGSQE